MTPAQNTAAYIQGFEDGKRTTKAEFERLIPKLDRLGAEAGIKEMTREKTMRVLMLKWAVAVPVFVTLRALADGSPHWFVSGCFGFTAYLLADMAVSGWMSKEA